MSSDKRLGVGILGAARIANKTCRAIEASELLDVVAVGSRTKAKGQEMLDRWGIKNAIAYDSYDAVLQDQNVDIVYIPLPTTMHLDWVQKSAAAGKHIMLEKPLAINQEDMDAIKATCKQHGVLYMDGTMWVHHPRTAKMKEALTNGALGNITNVHTVFTFAGDDDFLKTNIRLTPDCDALGALGDLGWYCVRSILWVYNYEAPIAVTALPGARYNESGVSIHMGATLLFKNGRTATFDCGFDAALTQTIDAVGDKGTLHAEGFVIPFEEGSADFRLTFNHKFNDWDCSDGTQHTDTKVYTDKTQERLMWEAFAKEVQAVKAGEKSVGELSWNVEAELTQRILFNVLKSEQEDCKLIELQ